jgi:hypothetical protein
MAYMQVVVTAVAPRRSDVRTEWYLAQREALAALGEQLSARLQAADDAELAAALSSALGGMFAGTSAYMLRAQHMRSSRRTGGAGGGSAGDDADAAASGAADQQHSVTAALLPSYGRVHIVHECAVRFARCKTAGR